MLFHSPSGLYLTKYRAYDPKRAIWLSRDPIGEAGGVNLYGYVGQSPIAFVDPSGLCPACIYGAYALAGALVGYYTDTAIQLVQNGGDIGALDGQQAATSALIGAALSPIQAVGVAGKIGNSIKGCEEVAIQFGKVDNQVSHAFRHVEKIGLDKHAVQDAIKHDLLKSAKSLPNGQYNGSVVVNGTKLDYSAYKLSDGTINVGRITPPRQ